MLQNDIRRADAVRHMSMDAGTRTTDRADSHGHRPQNRLTCPNTQGRPLPAAVPGLRWTLPWPFAVQRQRLMGMAGASPVKWNNPRLRNMCMAAGNLFRSWLGAWGSGSSGAEGGGPPGAAMDVSTTSPSTR